MNLNLKCKSSAFTACLAWTSLHYHKRIYWEDEGELLGVNNAEIQRFGYLNLTIGYDIIELRLSVGLSLQETNFTKWEARVAMEVS